MKRIIILLIILCQLFVFCSGNQEPNMVDPDQLNPDGTTNYRYIFKDLIEKQKWEKNRYKKDDF